VETKTNQSTCISQSAASCSQHVHRACTCGVECGLAGAVGNSKLLLQGLLTLPDSAP